MVWYGMAVYASVVWYASREVMWDHSFLVMLYRFGHTVQAMSWWDLKWTPRIGS